MSFIGNFALKFSLQNRLANLIHTYYQQAQLARKLKLIDKFY